MATVIGKLVKAGLNVVRPTARGWAKPGQTGWKAFLNGTQKDCGNSIIFQTGLKHKILQVGYPNAMRNFHQVHTSAWSEVGDLKEAYNRMPKCLHQAARELSDLMSQGVRI